MPFEHYLRSGDRLLRCGFTTGSCAALAASGAVRLLLTGHAPESLRLVTPAGLPIALSPALCQWEGASAVCAVEKDAGDDPDVTDGLRIFVRAEKTERGLTLCGGEGVGRVTKPGLDQPVGEAAINSVPRRMILAAAEEVCAELGYGGGLRLTVFVPGGEALAQKTFNPQLGVVGGISILGTSGVVEPMSEQALVDTIALALRQAARTSRRVILVPGDYGMNYVNQYHPALAQIPRVKCANFLGDAVDLALLEGFSEILLIGHAGKLVKLAGGIWNTHSRMADCRRELFCAHAALCGADTACCRALMEQVSSEGCLAVLDGAGLREKVMESLLAAIQTVLDRRAGGRAAVGALLFSNAAGLLGRTAGAEALCRRWEAET